MGFLYKDFIGRFGNLWAYLEEGTPDWVLTIHLFVKYTFVAGAHENDPDWTDEEEDAWITAFEQCAEATWSRRWLLEGYPPDGKNTVPLQVLLKISQSTKEKLEGRGRVTKITVFHDCAPSCPRKKVRPITSDSGDATQLSQNSVEVREVLVEGITHSLQRASDHEVGHMLGLTHPLCSGSEARCYGTKGTESGDDIMGLGMHVSRRDYEIFRDIIQKIRPKFNYWLILDEPAIERPIPSIRRIPLVGGGYRVESRGWDFVVKRTRP